MEGLAENFGHHMLVKNAGKSFSSCVAFYFWRMLTLVCRVGMHDLRIGVIPISDKRYFERAEEDAKAADISKTGKNLLCLLLHSYVLPSDALSY
jgi:hypothetical protein